MPTKFQQCFFCEYYEEDDTCDAFPEGIPEEILSGDVQHDVEIEGDNGIQFKPYKEN